MGILVGKGQSDFLIAATIAVVARIVAFVILVFSPFPYGDSLTAPIVFQSGYDNHWYIWATNVYFQNPEFILNEYLSYFFSGNLLSYPDYLFPGPVFPALLHFFDYEDGNTLGLSLFYLVLGSSLVVIWLRWMYARRVGLHWLILFALLPHEFYFTFVVSSDLPYAIIIAAFFFLYVSMEARDERLWPMLAVLLLAVLTRPLSISLVSFIFFDILIVRRHIIFERPLVLAMFAFLGLVSAVFYLPYFLTQLIDLAMLDQAIRDTLNPEGQVAIALFAMPAAPYLTEFPDTVSGFLGYLSDILIMVVLKILKLMGFHESVSGMVVPVVIRGVFGVIFLLGLVFSLLRGSASIRLLIFFTILPMLLGHSGWRYLLPILPLLFCYGVEELNGLMAAARQRIRRRKSSS